jgi:hypothetical protein
MIAAFTSTNNAVTSIDVNPNGCAVCIVAAEKAFAYD